MEAQRRLEAAEQPARHDRGMVDDFLRVLDACQTTEDEHDHARPPARAAPRSSRGQCRRVPVRGARAAAGHLASGNAQRRASVRRSRCWSAASPRCRRTSSAPCEGAWAVRYAGTIVGALWVRWSGAAAVMPDDADALMGVAAAAIAPAVQACVERGRADGRRPRHPDLVGDSDVMRALRARVVRAAQSPFPVLIEGESGSGKELVARAIHRASPRRDRRFSALNCAALSEELAEAELFGHTKGAFTGAVAERSGLFEEANGGTLFLDEVSELSAPHPSQAAARAPGERSPPSRRSSRPPHRRPHRRGDEPAAGARSRRRTVPARSPLPARRRAVVDPAAARAPRRRAGAGAPRLVGPVREDGQPRGAVAGRDGRARPLRLAGQRPRTAERAGVGDGHERRREAASRPRRSRHTSRERRHCRTRRRWPTPDASSRPAT